MYKRQGRNHAQHVIHRRLDLLHCRVHGGVHAVSYTHLDVYKRQIENCPPVLLLVARVADAWLATWSKADAITSYPVDPQRLPAAAAELLRARLAEQATA